jgi:hypothetical protein
MKLLKVQAASGLSVPMEDKPRTYVTDAEAVLVPDTAYYQRRLQDGDLVEVLDQAEVAALPPADTAPAAAADSAPADAPASDPAAPATKKPKGASTTTGA